MGLKTKYLICSGDKDPEIATKLGDSVLGIGYRLAEDKMTFKIDLRYRGKCKKRSES